MIIPGRKRLRQNRQHVEEADNNKENENDENLSFDEEFFLSVLLLLILVVVLNACSLDEILNIIKKLLFDLDYTQSSNSLTNFLSIRSKIL